MCKDCNTPPPSTPTSPPLQKRHSPLSQQPPPKVEVLSSPTLFENLVGGSTPQLQQKEGGGGGAAHYDPPISMFSLVKFCCQTPRTLPATFIWGERSFFHWKIDFLFCLNSFVQDCRLWIFSEKTVPNCLMVLKCILVHCML